MGHRRIDYRPDIDGLRAISIFAVLLYHAGISKAGGGFIGVDVFFVISGYLITAAIIHRLKTGVRLGPFLLDFYERRARRILPAYLATCFLVLAAGFILFLPDRLLELSKSIFWTSLLSANIFFWWTQDYFGPDPDTQPLLHYWSLGVEEHFYIAMPLLLYLAWRYAKVRIPLILIILAVLSFVAAEGLIKLHQSTVFYWFPFRAWELLCGGLLTIAGSAPRSAKISGVAVLAGIGMICVAIVLYSDQMRFPGATALLPCLGAVLVIWGGQRSNPASSLLKTVPVVYIGKISYSLYLIHWPIIVFSHELLPTHQLAAYEIVLSLLAASALYHFVETPTRNRKGFWSAPRRIFALSGAGVGLSIFASIVLEATSGLPGWHAPEALRYLTFRYDYKAAYREGVCFMTKQQSFADIDTSECLPSKGPTVLLWGDSLAAHYASALSRESGKRGFQFAQLTASSCAPIVGRDTASLPHCQEFNDLTLEWVTEHKPATIVLSALWPSDAESIELLAHQVSDLYRLGSKVVVLGQGPIFYDRVPKILAKRLMTGQDTRASDVDVEPRVFSIDSAMKARLASSPSHYIAMLDEICPQHACPLAPNGQTYYWDRLHTTEVGSVAIISRIADKIFDGAESNDLDLVKIRAGAALAK